MILKNIKLHPFAGTTDKKVSFQAGLNLICGPNEAGKSTLIRALFFVLFEPTNSTPAKEQGKLKTILPVKGGDTIAVDLEFESHGMSYTLKKKWGGTRASELISHNGIISDPAEVQKKVNELLHNNEATWRNVLFANQGVLSQTIRMIKEENDIINSFNGILRSAVMLQGGVSPEKLKAELDNKITDLILRWDIALNRPILNKSQGDHDNPWKVGTGLLVKTYYKIGNCKSELKARENYDKKLDVLAVEVESSNTELLQLETFIGENKILVDDLRKRKILEAEKEASVLKLENLKKDFAAWTTKTAQFKEIEKILTPTDEEIIQLQAELETANKRHSVAGKKTLLEQVNRTIDQLNVLEENMRFVLAVEQADLKEVNEYNRSIDTLRIKLAAQKLKLSLVAKKAFTSQVQTGLEEVQTISLETNENFDAEASGRIILETDDFTFRVQSGEADIDVLAEQFKGAEDALNAILQKYNVNTLAELLQLKQVYDDSEKSVKEKKRDKEIALNGASYEELKIEVAQINQLPATRNIENIQSALLQKKTYGASKKEEFERLTKDLSELKDKYQTTEVLQDQNDEARILVRDVQKKISDLKPLSNDIKSAEEFVNDFDSKKKLFEDSRVQAITILSEKKIHEQSEPEKTEEELKEELQLNELELNDQLARVKAYQKILEKLENILAQTEAAAFDPYRTKTSYYMNTLTKGKYSKVTMQDVLPKSISCNGDSLETALLSHGTNDCLALALRLSMADYFLQNLPGFIVLDDPLTDMDPGRQKLAAGCIENYANEKQVLLFTCHPAHVELFEGKVIQMGELY